MPETNIIDRSKFEIKLGGYAVGNSACLTDPTIVSQAQEYRRQVAARMIPLGKEDVSAKLPASDYLVSRKVDGEFNLLVWEDGQACCVNPGGTVRIGLPWLEEAAQTLQNAGVHSARIAGELYVHCTDRRPRVHDVSNIARNPQDDADLQRLRFAAFDIVSLEGQPAGELYADALQTLESLFGKGTLIGVVETHVVTQPQEIVNLFERLVEGEDAEGLVARSDTAGQFKIKPRHTLDVAVIGFTESSDDRAGLLHDLLVAVVREDNSLQVLCRVGGGFSEEQRRLMLSDLKDMVVASEYAEVNSDYVAYQMVRPEWIIEISCLDLISQTTRGGDVNRMVLAYDKGANEGYRVIRRMPLASVISPQFICRRDDKSLHTLDVSCHQISKLVEVNNINADATSFTLPKTEVIRREVFTKQLKGETMVRKFLLLKTNKQAVSEEHPAYAIHYTDFSPNRKDPLARDVRISNSLEQIEQLYVDMKAENIKKGWLSV
ncbi:MAG: ATP-dependent DNA ligase [Planctomycetales bacterium]|nr:ATP-dependent DNA ligase [Planctomycetales bacterium]